MTIEEAIKSLENDIYYSTWCFNTSDGRVKTVDIDDVERFSEAIDIVIEALKTSLKEAKKKNQ